MMCEVASEVVQPDCPETRYEGQGIPISVGDAHSGRGCVSVHAEDCPPSPPPVKQPNQLPWADHIPGPRARSGGGPLSICVPPGHWSPRLPLLPPYSLPSPFSFFFFFFSFPHSSPHSFLHFLTTPG